MTRYLEPADYRAEKDKAQLALLDDILRSLAFVHQHQIGCVRSTERVDEARSQLAHCINNLLAERNDRERISGKAVEQSFRAGQAQRLAERGGSDCVDVEFNEL